jgi:hypothetical protein
MQKKLVGWQENMLPIGDNATSVNVHLGIVTLYIFSFLEDPKGTIKRMNHHRGIML